MNITPASFASSSDDEIIGQAVAVLRRQNPSSLNPTLRQLTRARKPDVMVAGKFLWSHLTKGKI